MSWRTVAIIIIVVFAIVGLQSLLADPLVSVSSEMNATGDYSNRAYDGNALITSLDNAWFNMGLIMGLGLMVYGIAVVVKRELTRGQL